MPEQTTALSKDQILERSELIRSFEASVGIGMPEGDSLKFRDALMRRLFSDLPNLERRQVTRLHEAACKLDYPRAVESNFRIALEAELGRRFHLRDVRSVTIPGPVTQDRPRPQAAPAVAQAGRKG